MYWRLLGSDVYEGKERHVPYQGSALRSAQDWASANAPCTLIALRGERGVLYAVFRDGRQLARFADVGGLV